MIYSYTSYSCAKLQLYILLLLHFGEDGILELLHLNLLINLLINL